MSSFAGAMERSGLARRREVFEDFQVADRAGHGEPVAWPLANRRKCVQFLAARFGQPELGRAGPGADRLEIASRRTAPGCARPTSGQATGPAAASRSPRPDRSSIRGRSRRPSSATAARPPDWPCPAAKEERCSPSTWSVSWIDSWRSGSERCAMAHAMTATIRRGSIAQNPPHGARLQLRASTTP